MTVPTNSHQWKVCPENWHNKNRCTTSYGIPTASNTLSTQNKSSKGKVRSTESEESQSKDPTPIVRFEDIESDIESEESSFTSQGELMHIITSSSKKESLHPITILTLLDKE
jgi:hypothetical protein